MEFIAVDSSHVAAVGYDADVAVFAARFKDGAVWLHFDVTQEQVAEFWRGPSIGKALNRFKTLHASREVKHGRAVTKAPDSLPKAQSSNLDLFTSGSATPSAGPLTTFKDTEDCCSKLISKAIEDGALRVVAEWVCPKCGCRWAPRRDGAIVYWEPQEWCAILR